MRATRGAAEDGVLTVRGEHALRRLANRMTLTGASGASRTFIGNPYPHGDLAPSPERLTLEQVQRLTAGRRMRWRRLGSQASRKRRSEGRTRVRGDKASPRTDRGSCQLGQAPFSRAEFPSSAAN